MTLSKETEVIYDAHRGQDYDSANPPLYDSSTFHQQVLGGDATYDYARSGNPNRNLLEEKLAKLEGLTTPLLMLQVLRLFHQSYSRLIVAITSFYLMMYTEVRSV